MATKVITFIAGGFILLMAVLSFTLRMEAEEPTELSVAEVVSSSEGEERTTDRIVFEGEAGEEAEAEEPTGAVGSAARSSSGSRRVVRGPAPELANGGPPNPHADAMKELTETESYQLAKELADYWLGVAGRCYSLGDEEMQAKANEVSANLSSLMLSASTTTDELNAVHAAAWAEFEGSASRLAIEAWSR